MNDENKKIPVPEPENDGLEYVCPPASWGDMTGLIPTGIRTREEYAAYRSLYPYMPDQTDDVSVKPS